MDLDYIAMTKQEKIQEHYTQTNSGLNNNYILDITEHNGKLWLSTDGSGINQFAPHTQQFSQLQHIVGDYSSLPVNSITLLYKDQEKKTYGQEAYAEAYSVLKKRTLRHIKMPF